MPTTRRPSMDDWNRRNSAGGGFADAYQGYRTPDERAYLRNPLDDEQYSLLLNGRNATSARKLRTQGDIQRAEDEARFLESMQAQDTAGIYGAPTDARGARLQSLLNRDYIGRELGAQMIPTWQALQAKQKGFLANQLAEQQFNENPIRLQLAQQAASLNEDQFRDSVIQHDNANMLNREQLIDSRDWREYQKDATLENKWLREEERGLARSDRNQAHADLQTQREQTNVNQFFNQFHGAVEHGLMSADDAIASLPGLNEGQKNLFRARERAAADSALRSEAEANRLNESMGKIPQINTPRDNRGWVGKMFQDAPTGKPIAPEVIAAQRRGIIDEAAKNKLVFWDTQSQTFVPTFQRRQSEPQQPRGDSVGYFSDAYFNPAQPQTQQPMMPPRAQSGLPDDLVNWHPVPSSRGSAIGSMVPAPQHLRGQFVEGKVYPKPDGSKWLYSNGTMQRVQ